MRQTFSLIVTSAAAIEIVVPPGGANRVTVQQKAGKASSFYITEAKSTASTETCSPGAVYVFRGPFDAGVVVGTVQIAQIDDADILANRIPETPQPTRSLDFQMFVDNDPAKQELKNCPDCGSESLFHGQNGAKCMSCNHVFPNPEQIRGVLAPKANKLQAPEAAGPSHFVGESTPFGNHV
jgi:hypothetical protein